MKYERYNYVHKTTGKFLEYKRTGVSEINAWTARPAEIWGVINFSVKFPFKDEGVFKQLGNIQRHFYLLRHTNWPYI